MQSGAWQDPGYPDGSSGGIQMTMPSMTPVTRWILIVNLGAWLVSLVFVHLLGTVGGAIYEGLALVPSNWSGWFPFVPVWQVLTYGFLHSTSTPFHILFNLLLLYYLGSLLESILGGRRYLAFYLITIVIGGITQLTEGLITSSMGLTVGASGAVLGVVVATAVLRPNTRVLFLFAPLPLKVLAAIVVGMDVFYLLFGGGGNTAVLVHLSGAAFGFAAARLGWIWKDPVTELEAAKERREAVKVQDDEKRLDELLARIHKDGIHSLSKGERAFLKRVSKRS